MEPKTGVKLYKNDFYTLNKSTVFCTLAQARRQAPEIRLLHLSLEHFAMSGFPCGGLLATVPHSTCGHFI